MTILPNANPDHDEMSRLAREDPEAFETLRSRLIGEMIGRAPDPLRHRLEGLQFRLDHIHRRSGTALGATVKIYQLMWRSFLQLRHELMTYREPVSAPPRSAQVLAFRPRKRLAA